MSHTSYPNGLAPSSHSNICEQMDGLVRIRCGLGICVKEASSGKRPLTVATPYQRVGLGLVYVGLCGRSLHLTLVPSSSYTSISTSCLAVLSGSASSASS